MNTIKIILTSIITINMTILWGISYEMLIQVSSGNDDINLTIGANPAANNWYDIQFDIPAPPLSPSEDDFDARIINDYFPYDFYTDIRSDSVQSFHIAYQSFDNISINWDNTDVCRCYIEDLNNLIQQDMCNVDSLSIIDYELLADELLITCTVEGIIEGCIDGYACNYNPDATADDGSCQYNDCTGFCGGSVIVDECGVCGGSGHSECWDGSFVCDTIDCPEFNYPPIADAGEDTTYQIPHDGYPGGEYTFWLNASGSIDPDSNLDSLSFEWYLDVTLQEWNPQFTLVGFGEFIQVSVEEGIYLYLLQVTDEYGAASTDTVQITVLQETNYAPTAIPQAEVIEVNLPHDGIPGFGEITLSLDGSGSTDPESDELACTWEPLSSRPDDCVVNLSFSEGTYFYQLTVTDPYNFSDTADVEIIVNPELNTIPTVTVECDSVYAFHGNNSEGSPETDLGTVGCIATASDDDDDALIYNWIQISGNQVDMTISEDGSEISFTSIAGYYTFQANVTDPYGASASASGTAKINVAINEAPVANAGNDQEVEVPHDGNPETDTVDVTVSCTATDLENDPLTYAWDVEGCDGAECTVSLKEGSYTYTCTAMDTYGAYGSDTVSIIVIDNEDYGLNGCMDETACNYDSDTTADDGSCIYPEEGYNCDGVPLEFVYNQSTLQAFYYIYEINDLNGDPLTPDDFVATFNGDICVGSRKWDQSICNSGLCDIPAMGDDGFDYSAGYLLVGDMPLFMIYDASEGAYFDVYPYPQNYAFESNLVFNIDELVFDLNYSIPLLQYNNLVSFYVLPEDNSVSSLMLDIQDNIITVIGEGTSAQYFEDEGFWAGSLMYLDISSGYWLRINNADTLDGSGHPLNLSRVYNLHAGANLVSFPSPGSIGISEGFPDDIEDNIIAVIQEGISSMHWEGEWAGSLLEFEGLHGYWIITDSDISFSYELDALNMLSRNVNPYKEAIIPDGFQYKQSSMQCFYFVDRVELIDGKIENGDWLLSYNGDVLTGMRLWMGEMIDIPAMGSIDNDDYTAGYFSDGDVPTFKLLKESTGEMLNLFGNVPGWTSNGTYIIDGLYELHPLPEIFSLSTAYPNPFNPITTLSFALPIETAVSLKVYNLQGREIKSLVDGNMTAGFHSVVCNVDNHSSGMYFVKMVAGEYIRTQKLMLVK